VTALSVATHSPAVVMTAPTAAPRSLARQIRDSKPGSKQKRNVISKWSSESG
jgi:hypothetical protein